MLQFVDGWPLILVSNASAELTTPKPVASSSFLYEPGVATGSPAGTSGPGIGTGPPATGEEVPSGGEHTVQFVF